ncbi:MAG: hypothetical protein IJ504_06010 [Bacteroidales bacterium]|nr:hypothetical protein [Bacteroidales bacterium]
MKRFLLGFAAMATMVSCVTESGLERPEPRMVSLVTVSPETRTVLDGNDVLWENGDQVKVVFPSDSEPFKSEFTTEFEGAAVSMATFRGLLDDSVDEANGYDDGYAVYPKSAVGDDGTVSFFVPVEQRPREDGSFARDANLSASLVDLSDLTEDGTVDVRFRNALALVRFNLPANVASMKVTSATAPLAGAADLAFSDEQGSEGCLVFADAVPVSAENSTVTLLPPAEHEVFDTEVTYAMLVWPGEHELTIDLTDAEGGRAVKKVSKTFAASMAYTFNVSAEFVKPVDVSISAVAEHRYDEGILARSAVTLTFDVSPEELARMKNINVTVKSGDTVYKTYVRESLSESEVFFFNGPKVYMPKGDYDVVCTYEDELGSYTLNTVCSTPAPVYTLDLDFNVTASSVTVNRASVKISPSVLDEVPLKANNDVLIRFSGKSYYDFTTSVANALDNPDFIVDKTVSGTPNNSGKYAVICYLRFDGAEASVNYITANRMDGNSAFVDPWKKVAQITNVGQMTDGGMYVICADWDDSKYWYVDAYGKLCLSGSAPDANNLPIEYVFVFDMDNGQAIEVEEDYKYESVPGAWKSLVRNNYMSQTDVEPYFTQVNPAQYVKCVNGWVDDDGDGDIDICRGMKDLLGLGQYYIQWGGTGTFQLNGNNQWKWKIYEVER